ncbi:putative JAB1 Mov34 MPN PAD 1 ubiquitin protease [Trypanosoma vivax]|uniref:JAB1/MPN/MOV34 metalloenzyme domain-containing protein n=1 Tax=Trypanosoma vivax (strain Y486) TaxID=1055687 RepID=G0TSI0_TRYVY|nr:putative JAB1 Mov34 MPN PAD 1 ubiquitin protease [Trypanosoma vivax]CCC46907.1 conserved hypothetical protein [Trypanosoma vivax Y486]
MHEGKGADTFALSPYVAAGIIEHAKRLNCSAGYLVGDRSEGQVHVKDYIPCTHTNAEALLEEEFRKKMKAHLDIKKLSSPGVSILGWYAAGAPREGEVEAFNKWCMAPYVHFLQRNSLMVIAHMPTEANMTLRWEAFAVTSVADNKGDKGDEGDAVKGSADRDGGKKGRKDLIVKKPLSITIGSDSPSLNVMLADVTSKMFYGGGFPYPVSRIANLDRVAFTAQGADMDGCSGRREGSKREGEVNAVKEALLKLKRELNQSILVANSPHTTANKPADSFADFDVIADSYEVIQAEKNRQQNRDNFINESFRDALMMKYMAALLGRMVREVERNTRQDLKEKPYHGHHRYGDQSRKTPILR